LQLDEWVLCRLYNKKNNWEKVKVEEQDTAVAAPPHQNGEVMDAAATDAMSDSFQTHDSSEIIDNASALQQQQQQHGFRDMAQGQVTVKEDNEWFTTGLSMDDMQACYMSQLGQMVNPLAAGPGLDGGGGSSYLQSMSSPQMQMRMWQTVLPPY
jgi:hypothetical protein